MFVFTFLENSLSPTKKQMLMSSLDTNTQKLKTVGIYLADVLYKTKQEEIDKYIKEDIQEEVKKEINAKTIPNPSTEDDNKDSQLNREYNG